MDRFRRLFKSKCSVIGMVHLAALPGTPKYGGSVQKIVDGACFETEIYLKSNVDAILVENMHDVPYVQSKHFLPETVAVMSKICSDVKKMLPTKLACGVQVLACGNKEAIAIAKACSFNFVRVEGFVFSHIADEGFTDANAGEILRYRRQIDADDVLVFTDIKKKHSSHAITQDVSLTEVAKAAEFFLSDGLILTGSSTGCPADFDELQQLKTNKLPVLVGSGVTQDNFDSYSIADAVIIGSHFKEGGLWSNRLSEDRVRRFMDYVCNVRAAS